MVRRMEKVACGFPLQHLFCLVFSVQGSQGRSKLVHPADQSGRKDGQLGLTFNPKCVCAFGRATVHLQHARDRAIAGSLRFIIGSRRRGADIAKAREEPALDFSAESGGGYGDVCADVTKNSGRTQ